MSKQKYTNAPKSQPKKGRRYSPSEKKEILSSLENMTLREIHDKYGVVNETIRRWKKDLKFKKKIDNFNEGAIYSGNHPHWQIALEIWRSHPGLGPAQIRNQMYRQGIKINVTTVRNILMENGYTPPKTIIKEAPVRRYEAARP